MVAILNFSKTLTIGEFDSKIWIISDVKFLRPQKILEFDFWQPFWILVASLKKNLHMHMLLRNVMLKFKKID